MMGEKAAELLIECMQSKKPLSTRELLIPPRLVVRQSSLRTANS